MAFNYVLFALSRGKGTVVDDYDPEKIYQMNEAFKFYGRLYRTTVPHGPETFAAPQMNTSQVLKMLLMLLPFTTI